MGYSTRQSNGENYLLGPAMQLLDTAVLPNESCVFSTTYLFDDKTTSYKARGLKGGGKNSAVS
jgi:hypothetical protein